MTGVMKSVRRRFGLPEGFLALAGTEFWERFALAGVKSMLTLVLIDHVVGRADVFGSGAAERALEGWFGPLSAAGFASQIYGMANALLYLSVPLGGLLGDRVAGPRGAVYLGGGAMVAGLLLMPTRLFFLPGLILFATGAGTLKGNLSTVVGTLFNDDAARRRGFACYLGVLNAGVICGPFVCGALAVVGGWRWSMMAAAVAVSIGLAGYHLAARRIAVAAPAKRSPAPSPADARDPAGAGDLARVVAALLAVFLCFGAYEQIGNMFLVWARTQVALEAFGWRLPVPWLLSLDGLFTLALVPLTQIGLKALARRGLALGALGQIALGCAACALGNLVLAASATIGTGAVPIVAPLAYLLLIDVAIVLVWPAGLSLVTASAPARFTGLWVGIFYLHGFFANLWVGFGGAFYERMAPAQFWALHALLAAAGAGVALAAAGAGAWVRRSPPRHGRRRGRIPRRAAPR
ncbi:MFS transporter [Sphingomonas sanxanigenens]|nr:MFS transporter [Sphingomonas sanxanigenens]